MDIEADIPLQWDQAVEQLGDASPVSGRVDVGDAFSLELAREGEDFREGRASDDGAIIGQAFLRDANFFHGSR